MSGNSAGESGPRVDSSAAAGVIALENWTHVELSGSDSATLLHNLCTNDVVGLADGQGREAFLTDVKGKVLFHIWVVCCSDRLIVATVPERGEALIAHLESYHIREDVQMVDRSRQQRWILVAGEKALPLLRRAISADVQGEAMLDHQSCAWESQSVRVLRCPLTGEGSYAVVCSSAAASGLFRRLLDEGGELWWEKDLERSRVEAGYPLWGVDFDASNLPQEVGRNREAISFTKGCYLGQETVARLDALGHVNRRLGAVLLMRGSETPVGSELREPSSGKVVGETRSCVWSASHNKPLALAMLRVGHDDVGTQLESDCGLAEVVQVPSSVEA